MPAPSNAVSGDRRGGERIDARDAVRGEVDADQLRAARKDRIADTGRAGVDELECPLRADALSVDQQLGLAPVMQFLREGDELVVVRLDRLGRSTRDVLNLVHELDQKGASLRILDPALTTAVTSGGSS